MLLTAGTFLQEGRYWVEDILEQDESGVSYRAQYQNLDLPVVIQTLGSTLGDRPDKPQLLQAFLAEVRRQSKVNADQPYRILDCFIETGLPFVVLDIPLGTTLPSVITWLPALPPLPEATPPAAVVNSLSEGSGMANFSPAAVEVAPEATPPKGLNGKGSPISTQVPTQIAQPTSRPATRPPARPRAAHVIVSQAPARSRAWLPISLMMTVLVGGSTGAVFGWQLRQGKSLLDVMPVMGPQLDTEQSFPPLEGWPGATKSDPASTSGLDQVLRRRVESAPVQHERSAVREPVNVEPLPIEYGSNTSVPEPYNEFEAPEYSPDPVEEALPAESYPDAATQPEWTEPIAPEPEMPESPAPDPGAIAPEAVVPIEKPSVVSPPTPPTDIPNTRSLSPTPREPVLQPASPASPISQ